jgi:predicted nucleic acid-binding protein
MAALVLDAGILIDLEQADEQARAWFAEAAKRSETLLVAGATYVEIWRGYRNGKGHNMSRVLKSVVAIPTSEKIGRRAGEILESAEASKKLRLDAIVVATAELQGADVVTNDFADMRLLAGSAHNVRVRGK